MHRGDTKSGNGRVMAVLAVSAMSALACAQVEDRPGPANDSVSTDFTVAGAGSTNSGAGGNIANGGRSDATAGSNDDSGGASPDSPRVSDLIESYDQFELRFFNPWTGTCDDGIAGDRYTVRRSPARLAWQKCDFQERPSAQSANSRPLSAAELASITRALAKVHPTSEQGCPQDYPVMTLDVTNGSTVDHYDDVAARGCNAEPVNGRTFVLGLLELSEVILPLAQ